ncbi:hypothetical protein [Paenibacillus qinlingensis]|uniref:hypothetical protein n=1 Tax=Paenibacillus qinlingensis TaxID=1837343 RepID=UPI001563272B|nr:hypothetical protein [Paenibacillus qinlingensis]NQX60599.1 hypothetical protein [Paenibacillus qinlingensis]
MNKAALTPTVFAPNTDISIHLENTEEFNYIINKKSEIYNFSWEPVTELMPMRGNIKVPSEKGIFVGLLAIVMKSGKSARCFFAIDVR